MNTIKFPDTVSGQWIFSERVRDRSDTAVLMRCSFSVKEKVSEDYVLLVSACTSYQLFVNGRVVGVGPRAHHAAGTSFIDAHEIGYYLEPGNNLIAFFIHYCPDAERGDLTRVPGMWCQLQCGTETLLRSDDSWEIMVLDDFCLPRARVSEGGRLSSAFDLRKLPEGWNRIISKEQTGWEKPDFIRDPGTPGALIELHPVPPAGVNGEMIEFIPSRRGCVSKKPGFSCCVFPDSGHGKTGAAVSYVFCSENQKLKVRIYSDAPCKVFCNRQEVFNGAGPSSGEAVFDLVSGVNRLVLFSKHSRNSMGVMFCAPSWPAELTFLSDMLETAAPGWCVGFVEKLKYEECSFAVNVEALSGLSISRSCEESIPDSWDWLSNACFASGAGGSGPLREGDVMVFTLSSMHYGSVHLSLSASEGDIVDVILGSETDERDLFPRCVNGSDRETASFICREGENEITLPHPAECGCLLVYVRKSKEGVSLKEVELNELTKNFNRECAFSCADPFWNQVWQTGREILARSGVSLFPCDGCRKHDAFLMDAFFEAINATAVFGDTGYIASQLRRFAGAQLEDGSLPALSSGAEYDQALFHIFFFPGWILYNYRFSGNLVEMKNLLPKLDCAKRYLISLLSDGKFLLDTSLIGKSRCVENDAITSCRSPGVLNALFCRFMISASEVYDLAERTFDARDCRHYFRNVSRALEANFFDPEAGLFADHPIKESQDEMNFSLAGNFFPMFAGIKVEECFETFVKTFFDFETGAALTLEAESPYFHFLFTEMLFALGQKEWGFRYLRKYWKDRLLPGKGAWRDPLTENIASSSFVNGAAVVPNAFIIHEILGVRVAEPAHSLIYFDPAYELTDQVDAAIPTALGRLHISWKKSADGGGLEVNIYSSHPVKVLPELSEEMLKKTSFYLSDNVTLVKSAVKEEEK